MLLQYAKYGINVLNTAGSALSGVYYHTLVLVAWIIFTLGGRVKVLNQPGRFQRTRLDSRDHIKIYASGHPAPVPGRGHFSGAILKRRMAAGSRYFEGTFPSIQAVQARVIRCEKPGLADCQSCMVSEFGCAVRGYYGIS